MQVVAIDKTCCVAMAAYNNKRCLCAPDIISLLPELEGFTTAMAIAASDCGIKFNFLSFSGECSAFNAPDFTPKVCAEVLFTTASIEYMTMLVHIAYIWLPSQSRPI
jgi:hypothetical protein